MPQVVYFSFVFLSFFQFIKDCYRLLYARAPEKGRQIKLTSEKYRLILCDFWYVFFFNVCNCCLQLGKLHSFYFLWLNDLKMKFLKMKTEKKLFSFSIKFLMIKMRFLIYSIRIKRLAFAMNENTAFKPGGFPNNFHEFSYQNKTGFSWRWKTKIHIIFYRIFAFCVFDFNSALLAMNEISFFFGYVIWFAVF